MTLVSWALYAAVAFAAGSSLLCGAAVVRRELGPWAQRALATSLAFVSVPLALLIMDLARGSLDIHYVWAHTSTAYPWWLRVAGLWGGQEGTFLLWAWFVLGASVLEARRATDATWPHARATLALLGTLLLLPAVLSGLGQPTRSYGLGADGTFTFGAPGLSPLDLRPQGQGLNPLLETPYMAIHPPIEFLAYALTALPFAYALAHLARGGPYADACKRWARPAWLAFVAALALGAHWAYNVLSFGGYWAWDPVETADLLPFLALTVFLHATHVTKKGHLGLLAPWAAALGFVMAVFATFLTRSGLWASVHAFLPSGLTLAIEDPGERLLAIEAEVFAARYTAGLLIALAATLAAAVSLHHARASGAAGRRRGARAAKIGAALYAAFALLGLLAPLPATAVLHRLALAIGFGNTLTGAVGLIVIAAFPILAGLRLSPSNPPLAPSDKAGQLTLATYLLVLTLGTTLLLLVLGVNGSGREVFDARAPLLAGPILAIQLLTFHTMPFQRRVGLLGGAIAASAILLLFTRSWAWTAAPLALAALSGPFLLYADRAHAGQGPRARARAALLAASGILGLVHWMSPGIVDLAGVSLASPPLFAPVGVAASVVALLSPFLERRSSFKWWIGPACGVLAVGYGVGALAALASTLVHRGPVDGKRPELKKAGVPLIHIGVATLILGVALSTYGSSAWSAPQDDPLVRGAPRVFGAYEIELVDGTLVDADGDGLVEELTAVVHVRRGGTFVSEEVLRLSHSHNAGLTPRGGYVPQGAGIVRAWHGDVVLDADPAIPLAMQVRGSSTSWVTANGPPPEALEGSVEAVSLGVARLPGMGLVWGAIPLLLVGVWVRTEAPWRRDRAQAPA